MPGRLDRVQVVAADAAKELRKPPLDRVGVVRGDVPHPPEEVRDGSAGAFRSRIARGRAEPASRPVGQQALDRVHVVHHVAVADRARAGAVVAGHAPERRTVAGGHVDGKEEAVRPEGAIEPIEHEARLDGHAAPFEVQIQDGVQVLAEVHDERSPTVCPHCEVPPPRARAAFRSRRSPRRCGRRPPRSGGPRPRPARSGRWKRPWRSARGSRDRRAPRLRSPARDDGRGTGRRGLRGGGGEGRGRDMTTFSDMLRLAGGRPAFLASEGLVRDAGRRSPGSADHTVCTARFYRGGIRPWLRAPARRRAGTAARAGQRQRCTRCRRRRRDRARRAPDAPPATRPPAPSFPRTRP